MFSRSRFEGFLYCSPWTRQSEISAVLLALVGPGDYRLNPEDRDLESKLQRLSVRQFGLVDARCNEWPLSGGTCGEGRNPHAAVVPSAGAAG